MRVFATIFGRPTVESRVESLHDRLDEAERKLTMLSAAIGMLEQNRAELQSEIESIKTELSNLRVPVSFVGDLKP
jgi:chromosome segregation ATPase